MTLAQFLQSIKERKIQLEKEIEEFKNNEANHTNEGLQKYKDLLKQDSYLKFEVRHFVKEYIQSIEHLEHIFNEKRVFDNNGKESRESFMLACDKMYEDLDHYIEKIDEDRDDEYDYDELGLRAKEEMSRGDLKESRLSEDTKHTYDSTKLEKFTNYIGSTLLNTYSDYTIERVNEEIESVNNEVKDLNNTLVQKALVQDENYKNFIDENGNININLNKEEVNKITEKQNVSLFEDVKDNLSELIEEMTEMKSSEDTSKYLMDNSAGLFANLNINYTDMMNKIGTFGNGTIEGEQLTRAGQVYDKEKEIIGNLMEKVESLDCTILPLKFSDIHSAPVFTMCKDNLEDAIKLSAIYETAKFLKENNIDATKFLNNPIKTYSEWLDNYSDRTIEKEIILKDEETKWKMMGNENEFNKVALDIARNNKFKPIMDFIISLDPENQIENSKKLNLVTDLKGSQVVKQKLVEMKDNILDTSEEKMTSFLLGDDLILEKDAFTRALKSSYLSKNESYFNFIKEESVKAKDYTKKEADFNNATRLIELKEKLEKNPNYFGTFSNKMKEKTNSLLNDLVNSKLIDNHNMIEICQALNLPISKTIEKEEKNRAKGTLETSQSKKRSIYNVLDSTFGSALQFDTFDKSNFMGLVNPVVVLNDKYQNRNWFEKAFFPNAYLERSMLKEYKKRCEQRGIHMKSLENLLEGKCSINNFKNVHKNIYVYKKDGKFVNESEYDLGQLDEKTSKEKLIVDECKIDSKVKNGEPKKENKEITKTKELN